MDSSLNDKANKVDVKSDTNASQTAKSDNPNQQKGNDKKKRRRGSDKKKKKAAELYACPKAIVESVLAASDFKVANLSQIVEQQFQSEPMKSQIAKKTKDIVYKSSVDFRNGMEASSEYAILPTGFENINIEVPLTAIPQLKCIYDKTKPRRHGRMQGRKAARKERRKYINKMKRLREGDNPEHEHDQDPDKASPESQRKNKRQVLAQ